jgi:hypothetical protein
MKPSFLLHKFGVAVVAAVLVIVYVDVDDDDIFPQRAY